MRKAILQKEEEESLYVLKGIDSAGNFIKELGCGFLMKHYAHDKRRFLVSSSFVLNSSNLKDTPFIHAQRYKDRRLKVDAKDIITCAEQKFCFIKRDFCKEDDVKQNHHLMFDYVEDIKQTMNDKGITTLHACVFDGQKIIKLPFKINQDGTFNLETCLREDFPVIKATGAPVMWFYHSIKNRVIGLLDYTNGKFCPVFFKKDTFESIAAAIDQGHSDPQQSLETQGLIDPQQGHEAEAHPGTQQEHGAQSFPGPQKGHETEGHPGQQQAYGAQGHPGPQQELGAQGHAEPQQVQQLLLQGLVTIKCVVKIYCSSWWICCNLGTREYLRLEPLRRRPRNIAEASTASYFARLWYYCGNSIRLAVRLFQSTCGGSFF